jgi:prepilin peptidase CpaA
VNPVITLSVAVSAVIVALLAAVIDARTGKIPNYLTLPWLLLAPLAHGYYGGAWRVATSLLGALLCLVIPGTLYRLSHRTAIGGGDVKLFAALGAIVGPTLGLEMEFASFVLLGVIAVTKLTFTGHLWRLLVSIGWIVVNPFLPQRFRRTIEPDALTEMRMGPAIFLGVVLVIAIEHYGAVKWLA